MTRFDVRRAALAVGLLCCTGCPRGGVTPMDRATFKFTVHFENGCPKSLQATPANCTGADAAPDCVQISRKKKDRVKFKPESASDPDYTIQFASRSVTTIRDPDPDPIPAAKRWEMQYPDDVPYGKYKFTVFVSPNCKLDPSVIIGP